MLPENLILLPYPQGILTIYTLCMYVYIYIFIHREKVWEGRREIQEIMLGK